MIDGTTKQEDELIIAVKKLFAEKDDYGKGADFRVAFVDEIMDDCCGDCGRRDLPCYCTRDD